MIEAEQLAVADDAVVDPDARVRAESVSLGAGASLAAGVDICCDELVVGPGSEIEPNVTITAPRVTLGAGVCIAAGSVFELNERLFLGDRSRIGARVAMKGQSVDAGTDLDVRDGVIVGGGGWASADSRLIVGDRVSVLEGAFLNLSDRVSVGSDSEIGAEVAVLTHGAFHDPLLGYPAQFEPVVIGSGVAVHYDCKILPGVSVGDGTTIGPGAVVLKDLPAHCYALGSPARVIEGGDDEQLDAAARDEVVRALLRAWAASLPHKGVAVDDHANDRLTVSYRGARTTVIYDPLARERPFPGDCAISVSARADTPERRAPAHIDLDGRRLVGQSGPLVDDLCAHLRSRGLRIATGRTATPLPLGDLARLEARRG